MCEKQDVISFTKFQMKKRRKKEQAKLKKIKFKTHPTHAQTNNEMKNFFFDNKKKR